MKHKKRIAVCVVIAGLGLWILTAHAALDGGPQEKGAVPERVFFASGETALRPESETLLANVAEQIKRHPGQQVSVRGYTDSAEAAKGGPELARARIEAVLRRLADHGVFVGDFQIEARGAADPWGDNGDAEGRALNRRVDIFRRLPPAAGESTDQATAAIEVPNAAYTFQPILEGNSVMHEFVVRNTGRAELEIRKVRTG